MERAWTQSPEVRALTDAIDARQFKALSVGIGLGELRPVARPQPARSPEMAALLTPKVHMVTTAPAGARSTGFQASRLAPIASGLPSGTAPLAAALRPQRRAQRSRERSPAAASAPLSRRLFAYGLDFLFVAASLAVGFALATVLAAVRTGWAGDWTALRPVEWLAQTRPVYLLAGVYGAFFVYGTLFKLLAGRTVGEMLVRAGNRKITQKGPPSLAGRAAGPHP